MIVITKTIGKQAKNTLLQRVNLIKIDQFFSVELCAISLTLEQFFFSHCRVYFCKQ